MKEALEKLNDKVFQGYFGNKMSFLVVFKVDAAHVHNGASFKATAASRLRGPKVTKPTDHSKRSRAGEGSGTLEFPDEKDELEGAALCLAQTWSPTDQPLRLEASAD